MVLPSRWGASLPFGGITLSPLTHDFRDLVNVRSFQIFHARGKGTGTLRGARSSESDGASVGSAVDPKIRDSWTFNSTRRSAGADYNERASGTGRHAQAQARFPRPDLDEAALKAEQKKAQLAANWQVITTQEIGPRGPMCTRRIWHASSVASRGMQNHESAGETYGTAASCTSPGEQLERLREQRKAEAPPPLCIYDALMENQPESQRGNSGWEGRSSSPGDPAAIPAFFTEGPTDWRLEVTEDFDADWAWLSGGPWARDSGGPLGGLSERMEDTRIKVYVPGVDLPKPIALLNRHQLLQTLRKPMEALGAPRQKENGQQGPHHGHLTPAAPQTDSCKVPGEATAVPALPPEAYEALVERAKSIMPSFRRPQLLELLELLQQHAHTLQQQRRAHLLEARKFWLQATAVAQPQQPQQRELVVEGARRAEAAAAAAAKGIKSIYQQELLDLVFDATLPHLPVIALHAVDRACSARLGVLSRSKSRASGIEDVQGSDETQGVLAVLRPLALGVQRQCAVGTSQRHDNTQDSGFLEKDLPAASRTEGFLAEAGESLPETGGGLGFASRRLLEVFYGDAEALALQLQPLSRGHLLQLLVCCLFVGSGSSAAPLAVASQCIELLLRGPSGGPAAAGTPHRQSSPCNLQEALWMLISCAYRESRESLPSWLLPVLKGMLKPSSTAELSSSSRLGSFTCADLGTGMRSEGVRCSRPLTPPDSSFKAIMAEDQLQYLLAVLEGYLSPEGAPEALFKALSHTKHQPPTAAASAAEQSPLSEGTRVTRRFEDWTIQLKLYDCQGASTDLEAGQFGYLDEGENPKSRLQPAEISAAGFFAAVEALAWAACRFLRQQPQQQQEQQVQCMHKRIEGIQRLLFALNAQLVDAARQPLISASALVQGVHALADAAEHLKIAAGGPTAQQILSREISVGLLAAGGPLFMASTRSLQWERLSIRSLEALLEASCCCVVRLVGAFEALSPTGDVEQRQHAHNLEAAAATALVTGAAECLRKIREQLKAQNSSQTQADCYGALSLRAQGQWLRALGALLRRALEEQTEGQPGFSRVGLDIPEEAADAAMCVAASWDSLKASKKMLTAEVHGPEDLVNVLHGFMSCAEPLIHGKVATPKADAAAANKLVIAQGLDHMLDQLCRLSWTESDLGVAELARQLLQLQQHAKSTAPQGVLHDIIRRASTKKLRPEQNLSTGR